MTVWEFVCALALAICGGAAGAAAINAGQERWKFKADRKAKKEDAAEEKADKTVEIGNAVEEFKKSEAEKNANLEKRLDTIEVCVSALIEGERLTMLDRIIYLGQSYIHRGEITYEERKRLRDMHNCYHNKLGGNGDATLIMESVDELPLKK